MQEELLYSENIKTSFCKIENRAQVQVLLFQNKIFSITISYRNCASKDFDCSLVSSEFDKAAYSELADKLVVLPFYGSGKLTVEEVSSYEKYQKKLNSIAVLESRSSQNQPCFFPGLNSTSWRCFVGFEKFEGIIHTFGFAEIDTGTLFRQSREEIFSSQSFEDQKQVKIAAERFLIDVNLEIQRINTAISLSKDTVKKTKKIIESIQ